MKKRTLTAAIVTPIACAAAGVMIGQYTNADAGNATGYCADPTVYVDMAAGVSMVSGSPNANTNCDGDVCTVAGLEQVEINADGHVQCVSVGATQSLSLAWRGDGVVTSLEETAAP